MAFHFATARFVVLLVAFVFMFLSSSCSATLQIFGAWHCGDGSCEWNSSPSSSEMSWILNRGDGKPTFNVFSMAFADPERILNSESYNGMPRGMTKDFVANLQSKGVKVFLSIGGWSWKSHWVSALSSTSKVQKLAQNCFNIAKHFGVGIEIDYEDDAYPTNLDAFVKFYRTLSPPNNGTINGGQSHLLTVDLASSNDWLTHISSLAAQWVKDGHVNFVNRMVDDKAYTSVSQATSKWSNALSTIGGPYSAVGLFAGEPGTSDPDCKNYHGSISEGALSWVESKHVLGYFYWGSGMGGAHCSGLQQGSMAILKW